MSSYAAIGRHHEADLQYINDPTSQYYIPYPGDTMTCEQLQTNYDALTEQINYWTVGILPYELNSTAIANVNQIISIQTEKQTQYATKIAALCQTAPPPTGGGSGTTATKNNSLLWILLAAAAALFFLMKKKKTQQA